MSNQIVGACGMHFACFKLSCLGWNVMPTSRNARGIDIVAYQGDGQDFVGLQVKAMATANTVALTRTSLDHLGGQFWIIVTHARKDPQCYVLSLAEVRAGAVRDAGRGQWWLGPKVYKSPEFHERWDRLQPSP